MTNGTPDIKQPQILEGIPASPGVVIGKAFIIHDELHVPRYSISSLEVEAEIARLFAAVEEAKMKLYDIRERLITDNYHDDANLFDAHAMMLEDQIFIDRVKNEIETSLINAEAAVVEIGEEFISLFSAMEEKYFAEKAVDIQDIVKHLISSLTGYERLNLSNIEEEVIVIAHNLTPSDTALMRKEKIIAFATDVGSRISHTAILARSLGIPAVVGLGDITGQLETGNLIILDGNHGRVILNPGEAAIKEYQTEKEKFLEFEKNLGVLRDEPAVTLDGHEITLVANIEYPEEIPSVKEHGARGVGLYRTEYFYIGSERRGRDCVPVPGEAERPFRDRLPSEDELFEDYKNVVQQMKPYPVTIRTLDLGGEKFASCLGVPRSDSSLLGLRAIRLSLKYPDIFLTQLRAILRASAYGKVKIMFPMISGIEELRQAKAVLAKAKEQLISSSIPFDEGMEVGAMIELPSAVITADILAKEADFFSIGTNDLIQYSLAVNRANEEISELFEPFHPAVIRSIHHVVKIAHKHSIQVGLCGEMASDLISTLFLLGIGLDEFSMSPQVIPEIKKIIRTVMLKDARELAQDIMSLTTAWEIEEYLWKAAMDRFPELVDWIAYSERKDKGERRK